MSALNLHSIDNPYADFSRVYNRNEKKVQKILIEKLDNHEPELSIFDEKDLQDIYALTLNFIQAKYIHTGTIVISNDLPSDEIFEALDDAMNIVRNKPKV